MALAFILSSTIFVGGMCLSLLGRERSIEGGGVTVRPGGGMAGVFWLVPALVPGILIALAAYRMPRYLRVACLKCGWRERYRVDARGARPTSGAIVPMHHLPSPDEEEAVRRIEQIDFGPPAPPESEEDSEAEALAWAYAEIARGRSPEWVADALVQSGWTLGAAEHLAERTRKQTRHLRR